MEARKEPRRPTLRWDVYMRQVLCCLYRFFSCDNKETMEIFSYIFRSHLEERGIQGFVPYATLHTQWTRMKNCGDVVWYHVHKDTDFRIDAEWMRIVQKIKATAEILQFHLHEKAEDDTDTSLWRPPRSYATWDTDFYASMTLVSQNTRETTGSASLFPQLEERLEKNNEETQDNFPNKDTSTHAAMTTHGEPSAWHEREDGYRLSGLRIYEYRVKPNGNSTPDTETIDHSDGAPQELHQAQNDQTPTDDTKSRGQSLDCHSDHIQVREKHDQSHTRELSIDRIPPLLFRWWNRDSQGLNSKNQFLAGIFRHRERFDPKDITGTEFKAFFRRHVTKQEVATPFISTFSFPLAPFHRALTGQKGAMVSIIDTSKVTSKIFYAHPLAAQTRTFTHSWKGYAEYLVWGQIPAEAIVSTLDINSVGLIAQLNRDINRLLQPLIIGKMLRCNQKLRDILAIRRKGKSSFRCGLTLRKLLVLLQVPRAYWQDFASKFAHCWGWKYAQEKREFLDGVLSKRPYSQDELSDSESEWVMPTPQTTSKKASNGISSDLDEEDGEPLEYEEQELSDLERKSETTQRSPRQSFFYQGSSSPDLDWIPANEEEDTEDHSDSDTKDPNVSDSCSMSMEERSDTSEEPFSAETIDSMSEGESLTGVSVFVDRGNTSTTEDTVMHMDGGVSNGEDDEPDAQMEYECEWPSEDDCPERKTQAPIRFH